jgi:hypothetical protein
MSAIALLPRAPARDTALDEALARYDANLAAYRVLSAKLRAANRNILFDALAAARISHVVVTFDRNDEDGEPIDILADVPSARLTAPPVTLTIAQWGLPDPIPLELSISHALERMAFNCLEQTYGTYDVDFSGPDTLIFDVATRLIAPAPRQGGKNHA